MTKIRTWVGKWVWDTCDGNISRQLHSWTSIIPSIKWRRTATEIRHQSQSLLATSPSLENLSSIWESRCSFLSAWYQIVNSTLHTSWSSSECH
ncbi:mCG147273 [Mus musculus]|nr:mCG147273 [Mus musculus]